jgi:hypothetical protein
MISITGAVTQPTDAAFVWELEGFSFTDLVVESVYCHACHDVSQLVVGTCPLLICHCLCAIEVVPDLICLPFPLIQELL